MCVTRRNAKRRNVPQFLRTFVTSNEDCREEQTCCATKNGTRSWRCEHRDNDSAQLVLHIVFCACATRDQQCRDASHSETTCPSTRERNHEKDSRLFKVLSASVCLLLMQQEHCKRLHDLLVRLDL